MSSVVYPKCRKQNPAEFVLWQAKSRMFNKGTVQDFSKQKARAVEFLNPAMGFHVLFILNTSGTCCSKSSCISIIVDDMKNLIALVHSSDYKPVEDTGGCITLSKRLRYFFNTLDFQGFLRIFVENNRIVAKGV